MSVATCTGSGEEPLAHPWCLTRGFDRCHIPPYPCVPSLSVTCVTLRSHMCHVVLPSSLVLSAILELVRSLASCRLSSSLLPVWKVILGVCRARVIRFEPYRCPVVGRASSGDRSVRSRTSVSARWVPMYRTYGRNRTIERDTVCAGSSSCLLYTSDAADD